MANPNITMSEETKKFKETINAYFDYNRYGYTPEKGYWLLLLLCLIRNNAVCFINSKQMSIYERAQLKVIFYRPLKEFIDQTILTDEKLYSSDCLVINYPEKEAKIIEIAQGLGLNLSYDYHRMYRNDNLIVTFFNLVFISSKWYEENSAWAFKEILNKIDSLTNYKEYSQPREVSSLAVSLLNPADESEIYNPYSTSDYLLEFIASGYNNFYCHQTNNVCQGYIIQLAYLLSSGSGWSISNENSISHWMGERNFDYIISTPPWGVKAYESEYPTIELDYLAHSSRDTKYKSIGVYTSSICYSGSSKSVIKELIDNDWLETVILLPKNIFSHTAIEATIIVVNKNKEHIGKVQIIDASDCYIKDAHKNILDTNAVLAKLDDNDNFFSNLEIGELDYDIYPQLYVSKNNADIPENYLALKVNTILESYNGSRHFSEEQGKMVTIADLSDNSLSSKINIEELKATDDLSRAVKVTEPVFLFSRIRDLKPSYCEASPESPIFLHPNVFAYKLNREVGWVDYQYFCYEISRRAKNIAVGVIPSISKSVLQRLNVYFPSENIEDQRRIIKEALLQLKLSQAKELGLQELIENMKAEYMNEIRMRKHDMRPHLTNLGSIGRLMQSYIKQLDGMPELQNKLSSLVAEHVKAVESLSNLVSVLSEEQTFGKAEEINLNQLFIDLEKSNDPKISGFKLVYHIDRNALDASEISNDDDSTENIPLYVKIARIDFERLVSNILENARTHGFANREDNNGVVSIFVTVNSENDSFQIDFINNGNPLPDGMNKMRFGLRGEKAGNTGGTGNGGYIIKSIVEHYKGDYDVFMDADDTVIRVLLPISRESYE